MNKLVISMALAALGTAGAYAQGTTTSTSANTGSDQHCLAQADDKTWSSLGLNEDQIKRVKEIQKRYKDQDTDRGTENTMRGTSEDSATPKDTDRSVGSTSGTTGTDRTTSTSGTTGSDSKIDPKSTVDTDRTSGSTTTDRTTGTTGKDMHGTTSNGRDSDQLGYDDSNKEAMERELRTVLTTAQFDRYQEWCQDQDSSRGDSNTDMDR